MLSGPPIPCDDGNPCTDDGCDSGAKTAKTACTHLANAATCTDASQCTKADVRADQKCAGTPINCDDANPCTNDDCTALKGCTHAPNNAPCDDANPCTVATTCTNSKCKGKAKVCQDANAGTLDSCLPIGGCHFSPSAIACDNGDSCTTDDKCAGKVCKGGAPKVCVDGDACTLDGCAKGKCAFTASKAKCDDDLAYLDSGNGDEVVDVEIIDNFAFTCGDFGTRIARVTDPANIVALGGTSNGPMRCQRMTAGAKLANGTRVVYVSHHGDDWVKTPFLATYQVSPMGAVQQIHKETDAKVLFEGMRWHKQHLYSLAHTGGLRTYTTAKSGKSKHINTLGGFANAWKIELIGQHGYVADAEGGVRVVSIKNAAKPVIAQSLKATGMARDITGHAKRLYVALGGHGIDVFKRTSSGQLNGQLSFEFNVAPQGSVQAVHYDNGLLATANWSHSAVFDAATLHILASEKVKNYRGISSPKKTASRSTLATPCPSRWAGLIRLAPASSVRSRAR